ncbi:EAL domain-containing protein [Lacticaseibacillus daqingensis]|uniref:EAL domain-containing protein n=1 Tax=Lacticaseibacillus daqingensis TaxID=2486014 RepID=UPI000F7758BC|nr:EAL domain-containing protein [Lacticaseibacillus daqingensis]
MGSLTFFAQPIFALPDAQPQVVGYELLARTRYRDVWTVPENVGAMTPDQLRQLVMRAVRALPQQAAYVAFNLHPRQFVRPAFLAAIVALQARCPVSLVVELTETRDPLVPTRELVASAHRYAEAGVPLWIDDVGSGQNLPGVVEGLTPACVGYKFALQELAGWLSPADLRDRFSFWRDRAQAADKRFVLVGVETEAELALARQQAPHALIQGCYLGAAAPLDRAAIRYDHILHVD